MAAVLCPAQENRIPFADPYILEADGIYYMYGTSYDDGIGVVMSTDLKNWTVPGGTERHVALSKDDSYGNFWFWAPEVYHVGDSYYMYYSSEEHICAAVSDSPLGLSVRKSTFRCWRKKALTTVCSSTMTELLTYSGSGSGTAMKSGLPSSKMTS